MVPLLAAGWLTWTLVALGLVVVVVPLAMMIWGRFLPATWTADEETHLPVPPEEAWRRATDFEKRPLCVSSCRRVERLPDENGLPVYREELGPTSITVRTVESRPPRRLVRDCVDSVVPVTLHSELDLEPAAGGTRARMRLEMHVRDGTWHVPFFRVALKLGGGARKPARQYLASLAKP